ncbi:MAG: hypothetical protein ACREMP_04215 [Candidatus Tyrphobacter sp.]
MTGAVQSNGGQTFNGDRSQHAAISDYAFASSSGNIGANVASGNANQQSNAAFVGTNGDSTLVVAGAIQHNGGNRVYDNTGNHASVGNNAFAHGSGNIAANVAAGNGNQQANALYVNTVSTESIAIGLALQHNGGNTVSHDGSQHASISDGAFDDASGNIGANVAAGNLNQQSNSVVVLTDTNLHDAGAGAAQSTGGSQYCNDGHNHASVGDYAFSGGSGNIGANIASGNANQQSNVLVVNTNP